MRFHPVPPGPIPIWSRCRSFSTWFRACTNRRAPSEPGRFPRWTIAFIVISETNSLGCFVQCKNSGDYPHAGCRGESPLCIPTGTQRLVRLQHLPDQITKTKTKPDKSKVEACEKCSFDCSVCSLPWWKCLKSVQKKCPWQQLCRIQAAGGWSLRPDMMGKDSWGWLCFRVLPNEEKTTQVTAGSTRLPGDMKIYDICYIFGTTSTDHEIWYFLILVVPCSLTRNQTGKVGRFVMTVCGQCVKNLYMVFVCFPLSLSAFGGELVRRSFLVLFLFALYLHNLFVVFLLTFGCFMQHSSHTSV